MIYNKSALTAEAAAQDADLLRSVVEDFVVWYTGMIYPAIGGPYIKEDLTKKGSKLFESDLMSLYQYATRKICLECDFTVEEILDSKKMMIFYALFLSAASTRLQNLYDVGSIEMVEAISPRIAYAMRRAEAKKALRLALEEDGGVVSPVTISTLADVHYTYIVRLIKQGTLPATKSNGQWYIPATEARDFLVTKYDL